MKRQKNYLCCWKESRTQKWKMVGESDKDAFLYDLLLNPKVDIHTIFIIPVCDIIGGGIWVDYKTHEYPRVDFWNFFEEFGTIYKPPIVSNEAKKLVDEDEDKRGKNTKYGWISPEGKYFHCDYQGHSNLAYDICFGLIETNNPEQYLEEHGWCKIYKPLGNYKYRVYVGGKYTITEAQMKTLKLLGLEDAEDLGLMLLKD